jgi:hypothetical protein
MKKLSPWCLAAIATMAPLGALGGITGAVAGHTAILAVTVGIFLGTLSLGRTQARPTTTPLADASAQIEIDRRLAPHRFASSLRLALPDLIRALARIPRHARTPAWSAGGAALLDRATRTE